MNKPTRGQWRGYVVLCVLLAVALLLLIVLPSRGGSARQEGGSDMSEALSQYGDSLVGKPYRNRQYYAKKQWRHDSTGYRRNRTSEQRQEQRPEWNRAQRTMVELNSADTLDLQQLFGIGPAFARRIVKYRQLLGGFVDKRQLLEVYGMDEERYRGFADQLQLDSTLIIKIALNSATIDDLKRHPYIDYYQAKALVRYREQAGPFQKTEELLKVNLIDTEFVTKIEPYIQLN